LQYGRSDVEAPLLYINYEKGLMPYTRPKCPAPVVVIALTIFNAQNLDEKEIVATITKKED
jgi:hypothetical protein